MSIKLYTYNYSNYSNKSPTIQLSYDGDGRDSKNMTFKAKQQ